MASMNRNGNGNIFAKTITIPVWSLFLLMIIGMGSMAIAVQGGAVQGGAVHQEDAPDIQHSSDVKVHLQDVDGKVITNVPIMANRAFSPLPVEFDADDEASLVSSAVSGTQIITKQKIAYNVVLDVSSAETIVIPVVNNSEDEQIFLIKANAPSHVILDMEDDPADAVTIHGLTGHNEWLASIDGDGDGVFDMELSTTDAGFYPIVVELLRIG